MLTAHHLSKSFQNNIIFQNVSFSVNAGERVGLIGPNGCGKTTLLRLLTSESPSDSGHVSFTPSSLRIGYLSQGFTPPPEITVKELIGQAAGDPEILEPRLTELGIALAKNPSQLDIQVEFDQIIQQLERSSNIGRFSSILAALGLDQLPDDQLVSTLSGGQKTRLALALVLLTDPQLLLLDEPTNHLDIQMLEWLEAWLRDFRGAVLIVSHDRTFLENTVTRILDLNPATLTVKSYDGSYNEYIKAVTREHDQQIQTYNDQVAEIRRMKRDIMRTRAQAERTEREASSIRIGGERMKLKGFKDYQQGIAKKVARKAKSRERKLDRYLDSDDRIDKPKAGWQIKLEFDEPAHLGKQVLSLEDLAIGYPKNPPLLEGLNLHIQSGQRIALTGPNGSGKTTLLRVITNQMAPLAGNIRIGTSVKPGYMSQEQEILNPEVNAVETIRACSNLNQTETRNFLHYFLFSGDDPLRPVHQLSYGERSRLMLACLVAKGCNFLLLDEPINHLDIPSREQFEQALANFSGTVLAVIHDRYFIQRFATDIWEIHQTGVHRIIP